jgi:hypothetical protein
VSHAGRCFARLHFDFADSEADLELIAYEPRAGCLIEQKVELFFSVRRVVTPGKNPCAYDANVEVLLKISALFPERSGLVDFSRGFLELPFHKERTCRQRMRAHLRVHRFLLSEYFHGRARSRFRLRGPTFFQGHRGEIEATPRDTTVLAQLRLN